MTLPPLTMGMMQAQLRARPALLETLRAHQLLQGASETDQYVEAATLVCEAAQRPLSASILAKTHFDIVEDVRPALKEIWEDPALGTFRELFEAVRQEQPDLCSGDPAEWRRRGGASEQFVDALVTHALETRREYSGLQDLSLMEGMKVEQLVRRMLEGLYKEEGVELGRALACEVGKKLLNMSSLAAHLDASFGEKGAGQIHKLINGKTVVPLLKRYREAGPMALENLSLKMQEEIAKTVPGSPERIALFWQLQALEYEMNRREDFSQEHYLNFIADVSYPRLSKEERKLITDLRQRADEPGNRGRPLFQAELLDGVHQFYRQAQRYALEDPDGKHWLYLDAAQNLATQALGWGVHAEDLATVFSTHHLERYQGRADMELIQKRTMVVRPSDLPAAVITELKNIGTWDLVQTYVQWVALMPHMEASEQVKQLIGSVPHGLAYHILDLAKIATQSPDGPMGQPVPFKAHRLAILLSHEAEHLKAMTEFKQAAHPDQRWLTNVVQERRAYAREAQSYRISLARRGGSLDHYERFELQQSRFNSELIVHACNLLMGLPWDAMLPEMPLPEPEQAARRFHIGVGEVDLNAYPTHLVRLIGQFQPREGGDQMALLELQAHLRRSVRFLEDESFRLKASIGEKLEEMGADTAFQEKYLGGFDEKVAAQTRDYQERLGLTTSIEV